MGLIMRLFILRQPFIVELELVLFGRQLRFALLCQNRNRIKKNISRSIHDSFVIGNRTVDPTDSDTCFDCPTSHWACLLTNFGIPITTSV